MFYFFVCYNLIKEMILWEDQKVGKKCWTAEEKYEVIKPIINFEKSSSQVTKDTGLSNGMLSRWGKLYNEKGIEG